MYRNRERQRHPDGGVFQRGEKRCQTFGKVVRGNRKRRHHADAGDVAAFVFLKSRVVRVECFMRVRHDAVNQRNRPHARQKSQRCGGKGFVFVVNLREGFAGFGENLRQRHIHHRPARKRQAKRQYARVGRFGKHHQPAAQYGEQAGGEGNAESYCNVGKSDFKHGLNRSYNTRSQPNIISNIRE